MRISDWSSDVCSSDLPGESLEEAVVREIWEEVGLRLAVEEVRYQSSQPWPFPSSIMLGFYARAEHQPPSLGPDELESARWFSRDELLNSPEAETFKLPRRDSIARRLIEDWLAGEWLKHGRASGREQECRCV